MWILILAIMAGSGSVGVTTVEFKTQKACENAREALYYKSQNNYHVSTFSICVAGE